MSLDTDHPLSHIFSAKKYTSNLNEPRFVFYDCVLHDKYKYERIEWDIEKSVLRLYHHTDSRKKDIKCLKLSLFNCKKEKETLDSKESKIFIKQCRVLYDTFLTDTFQYRIRHQDFKVIGNKMMFIVGESHNHYHQAKIVEAFNTFARSFPQGMIVDIFFEALYSRRYIKKPEFPEGTIYRIVHRDLSRSPHVRFHLCDYRSESVMQPFKNLFWLLDKINVTFRERTLQFTAIRQIYTIVFLCRSIFNFKYFKEKHFHIYKQFEKSPNRKQWMELIKKYMDKMLYHVTKLLIIMNRIKEEHDTNNTFVMNEFYNNPIMTHYFLPFCFFMDIYTIGRMLKPGYNYCMFYGGCAHSTNILRMLQEIYELKPVKDIPLYHDKCPPDNYDVFNIHEDDTDTIKKKGISAKWLAFFNREVQKHTIKKKRATL